MVSILTALLRKDPTATVTESAMLMDSVLNAPREVDICVQTDSSGHMIIVGIECRAWRKRQTVEWVEAMHGKHLHLPTDALVLVSSSGFTKAALLVAKSYNIRAITPTDVTPGFVGEIVNNLESVWSKLSSFTPERMRLTVQWADGTEEVVQAATDLGVFRADGSLLFDAPQLANELMMLYHPNNDAMRDATGDEKFFEFGVQNPVHEGAPMYLRPLVDEQPVDLVPIIGAVITGPAVIHVVETPLRHGEYNGAAFSTGTATLGDRQIQIVVTEDGNEAPKWGSHAEVIKPPKSAEL
jgi:hypothetical protein